MVITWGTKLSQREAGRPRRFRLQRGFRSARRGRTITSTTILGIIRHNSCGTLQRGFRSVCQEGSIYQANEYNI